ncbi:MAG: serine/threonine-protein kinase, partial [Cyanobacteriota bacterium]|nr:serine/threonine-protein kinase [Cyanobacteriota bacterium]
MLTSGSLLQNRYHLQQQLSHNPARQTWLARDLNSQIPVVVKFLALGGAVQWEELKLFEREAKVLEQLDSPRIPKYYDYFSVDDQKLWFALVQQYIPGVSLKQRLEQSQPFSGEQVRQIVREVLELLQYLHTLNPPLLHRDLKPSNLLWGDDDRVYLLDFGGVQVRPPATGATFTVVGTYGYTPLEQYGGQSVPASDLYALGATAVHLLTGAAPSELIGEDLRLQFRDRLGSGVEPQWVAWLEKMTEPSVQKRFSSAKEALEALKPQASVSPPKVRNSRRVARISKSSQELIIEIPSRFEIEFIRPWGNRLDDAARGVGGWMRSWRDRLN